MNASLISMSVRQMLIVVIILDHTLANARVVILAMAKFVIKVCVCVYRFTQWRLPIAEIVLTDLLVDS